MIWTLKLLSEHPDVQRKLRTELDLVLPHFDEGAPEAVGVDQQATPCESLYPWTRSPSYIELIPLPSHVVFADLDAVVHEILRVEAVVPLTRRRGQLATTRIRRPIPTWALC